MTIVSTLIRRTASLSVLMGVVLGCSPLRAQTILAEGFESGVLGSQFSVSTVGTFSNPPGIAATTDFGSTRAFSFGRSTCSASCFGSFVTTLTINLGAPTFVGAISFKEMEAFDNWGSNGSILLDGLPTLVSTHFGRVPDNDRNADTTFRSHYFQLDSVATTIQFRVVDITTLSAIRIDDLVISAVPESSTSALLALGVAGLLVAMRYRPRRDANRVGGSF